MAAAASDAEQDKEEQDAAAKEARGVDESDVVSAGTAKDQRQRTTPG
jgi:hypothetical protein